MLEGLKKVVGTVAPFLGSMIGGPFGGAVGVMLGKALLGNENATEDEIALALGKATPEQLVKLRGIDADYKAKMAQLGIDEQKIHALDRASARDMGVKSGTNIPAVLAVFLTLGFFGILLCLMFTHIQAESRQIINIMLGSLGTAWISVITYYFGSSVGSHEKTKLLDKR